MRYVTTMLLTLVCVTALAQAKYLDDKVTYSQMRFIVKAQRDIGDLEPQFDGTNVKVFDSELTALNQKWGIVHVRALICGSE